MLLRPRPKAGWAKVRQNQENTPDFPSGSQHQESLNTATASLEHVESPLACEIQLKPAIFKRTSARLTIQGNSLHKAMAARLPYIQRETYSVLRLIQNLTLLANPACNCIVNRIVILRQEGGLYGKLHFASAFVSSINAKRSQRENQIVQ